MTPQCNPKILCVHELKRDKRIRVKPSIYLFIFLESFNLWRPLLMIALYHQTKTPISFLCSRGLNLKSLIQLSETLPVKLTRTHNYLYFYIALVVLFLHLYIKNDHFKYTPIVVQNNVSTFKFNRLKRINVVQTKL